MHRLARIHRRPTWPAHRRCARPQAWALLLLAPHSFSNSAMCASRCLARRRTAQPPRVAGTRRGHGPPAHDATERRRTPVSRAGLRAMVRGSAEMLLLDEPTNPMDIAAGSRWRRRGVGFRGIVVVSHDAWFLSALGLASVRCDGEMGRWGDGGRANRGAESIEHGSARRRSSLFGQGALLKFKAVELQEEEESRMQIRSCRFSAACPSTRQ